MHVVVMIAAGENKICFKKGKPFLGTKAEAADLAVELKDKNPEFTYVVAKLEMPGKANPKAQ